MTACQPAETRCETCLATERLFPTAQAPGDPHDVCQLASPLAYEGAAGTEILNAVGEEVVGVDPATGARIWSVTLPAPDGELAFAVATPLLVSDKLVVAYHTTDDDAPVRDAATARHRQRVAVIDLVARDVDSSFPPVDLEGSAPNADGDGTVFFDPGQALSRGRIVGGLLPGDVLGKAYVTVGNARDIQPWHGFAFELDLDAWLAGGADAATTGFFVTTPETDCGTPGTSGSRARVCGGGLWSPSGPLLLPTDDGYELVLAAGNGQLDLARDDFANTMMRVGPGLDFDPACDAVACADFDPDAPATACVESCANLHVPRMPPGEDFASLVSKDRCLGLGLFECWEKLDYVGGSTPALVRVGGFDVLLYPTKDGSVYLVDANHLGTQYERRQLVPVCGTATSSCTLDWAGMIVTQPTVTEVDGAPLAIVPTFMPDGEQEAGIFALRVVVKDGAPALEEAWRWPAAGTDAARTRFRGHPSRAALVTVAGGREIAVVIEARTSGGPGNLVAIDVATGALVVDTPIAGRGQRFVLPLVLGDRVYFPSCESNAGPSILEGHRIVGL